MVFQVSEETVQKLRRIGSPPSEPVARATRAAVEEIQRDKHGWTRTAEFAEPARYADGVLERAAGGLTATDSFALRKAVMARLALEAMDHLDRQGFPASIAELYPVSFDRLANHLAGVEIGTYDHRDDAFCKDLRFVLLMTVPVGALVLDLRSYVPLRSVLLSAARSRSIAPITSWAAAGGHGVWARIHADSRYLDEFHAEGWERCYLRIADLLRSRPGLRGLTGTSWFYDPEVARISPRLAYLRDRPLARGGTFLKNGTGRIHVERATLTSRTRRRLYEEGAYLPTCYSLVWPRARLLEWADSPGDRPDL